MITLKGMTWDHSRGYDPMIATSKVFEKKHNNEISIEWDKRSLQAFADRPIEQMVEESLPLVELIGSNTDDLATKRFVGRLNGDISSGVLSLNSLE